MAECNFKQVELKITAFCERPIKSVVLLYIKLIMDFLNMIIVFS